MPYICMSRDDVADGTVQVLDLFPNTSQRNLIYDGEGQTRYINRANTSAVSMTATFLVSGATSGEDAVGLGAYLVDTMDSDGGGTLLTTAEIASAVEDIMGLVDNALAITAVTAIGAIQAGTYSGSAIGSASFKGNFSLEALLKVLAGAHYKIDKGTLIVDGSSQGAFVFHSKDTNLSSADTVTKSYDGEEFQLSINSGHLASFVSSITLYGSQSASESATGYPARQHPSVKNRNAKTAASARIVVIYNDDGSVLA